MEQMNAKERKEWEEWLLLCKRIENGADPFRNESEADKSRRIKRLLKPQHFGEFIQYYFAGQGTEFAPLAWFHEKAIDNLLVKKLRKHIWEWHRESAKSVIADIFILAHMLLSGQLKGLILASETSDKAKGLIKDLEAQLRYNRRLINDFGDFGVNGSWKQGFYQTKDGKGFWAFGLGQNPAGVRQGFVRPNVGIVDDSDSKDLAKNQRLTKETIDWIKGEFMGCLSKDDRYFIYLNNRVHKYGLTAHLVGDVEEGDPKDDSYAHIKAYLVENPQTHEAQFPIQCGSESELLAYYKSLGKLAAPAWDEYYSIEDAVAKIWDYGWRNSMRQMFHTHIEDGDRFTDENMPWVKALPMDEYDALVSYCDPAFGESKKGCFRAVILVGRKGSDFDILWCWLSQSGSFAQVQYDLAQKIRDSVPIYESAFARFRRKVNCAHYVESNELQKILLKQIYKELNRTSDASWMPIFDMDHKADKIGRIESLEPLAQHGHLRFNEAERKNKHMLILRDQFKGFPDGFVDGPDATEGAISKLNRKVKSSSSQPRAGKYTKNTQRVG